MPNPQNVQPHQFKPGQSGNPAGYSRNRRVSDALSRLIDEKGADGALATVWLKKALEGNPVFFGMLLDRIEGKVPTTAGDDDSNTIKVAIEYIDTGPVAPAARESEEDP